MNAPLHAISPPRPVQSHAEAEQLIVHLMDVMDALLAVIREETKLVRNGRTNTAVRLDWPKSDLAQIYVAAIARLRSSQAYLRRTMPGSLATLHRRHDVFRALLQIDLTVLAAAYAVAEGRLRDAPRGAAPQPAMRRPLPAGRSPQPRSAVSRPERAEPAHPAHSRSGP